MSEREQCDCLVKARSQEAGKWSMAVSRTEIHRTTNPECGNLLMPEKSCCVGIRPFSRLLYKTAAPENNHNTQTAEGAEGHTVRCGFAHTFLLLCGAGIENKVCSAVGKQGQLPSVHQREQKGTRLETQGTSQMGRAIQAFAGIMQSVNVHLRWRCPFPGP